MNQPVRQTVLIVDDTQAHALALASVLQGDWHVETAADGETALRIAATAPDLLLLRVRHPGPDEFEVLRQLKQNPTTCDIPVIVLATPGDPRQEASGLALGAADFITEPVTPQVLYARVRNQLALRRRLDQLEHLAGRDGQTGLYNRRRLDELLIVEVGRARRYGRDLSLILLDIDRFKTVNDTHGHLTGDDVLAKTAELLQRAVRGCDTAGRWGGDEFAIICPETAPDQALLLAERLRQRIAACDFPQAGPLTVSLGVASFREKDRERDLLANADAALYLAKARGRNRAEQAIS